MASGYPRACFDQHEPSSPFRVILFLTRGDPSTPSIFLQSPLTVRSNIRLACSPTTHFLGTEDGIPRLGSLVMVSQG